MKIEERITEMHADDLDRLLSTLNFALSGADVGEAGAFNLLAEIEAIAIKEYRKRNPEKFNNNPLGGLPDEQQAGYIG